jgi:hypothetical protein
MRTTRKALLVLGWLGAVACGGSAANRAEESARAMPDSEPAPGGTPIANDRKLPCGVMETVASGDSVAVSFSSKDKKLKVEKQTANDTAHHPMRLVDCVVLYSDTAHQPGPK